MFNERLKKAMQDLNLKQSQVVGMTGKSKGSISQYLSGKQVPSEEVQRDIAVSLGLEDDYFSRPDDKLPAFNTTQVVAKRSGSIRRLTVQEAANLLGADKMTVSKGLQQQVFPWGYAIKTTEKSWTYIINADSFARIEGVVI
jgi:hypothetical protein